MFVVRGDHVLKHLLTFQYVSEIISLWFCACMCSLSGEVVFGGFGVVFSLMLIH